MEKQEWQEYVRKVASCDYPIPLNLINDYDDWKCRSNVGRMLMILKDIEGAMAVLATVKDVQPDMTDAPEFGLSEAEHKVLCLRDIAEIIWQLTGTGDAPLVYLKEAYRLCRAYDKVFRSADRGAIWARALEIRRSCGDEAGALADARAMLAAEGKHRGVNPYAFHAFKFMAEGLAAQGEYAKAAFLLADAYAYFPLSEAGRRDLAAAAAISDVKERYEAYLHCTTIQYQPWEQYDIPTLDDVRRLQERNFALREAAKAKEQAELNGKAEAENLINKFK